MDNSAIEKIGAAQLDIIFSKTGIADPHIKRDEKTMSWDGTVSVFSSEPFSKSTHIGDIPVQVKTHMVDKFYSHIDVEIADLKIYKKEKRVLYLVVENKGDKYKVFYKALFLWDLEKILSKANGSTKRLPFEEMPYTDTTKVKKLLFDFIKESNKQHVTIPNVLSLQDLGAKIYRGELKFDIDLPLQFTEKDILKGVAEQKPYIYFYDKELNLSFPVDRFSEQLKLFAHRTESITIGANNKVYFTSLEIIKTAGQTNFKLGKSISGTFYPEVISFRIDLKGSLEERKVALEFIIALVDGAPLEINQGKLDISLSSHSIEKEKVFREELNFLKDIEKLFNKSYITKQLDLDKMTQAEAHDLRLLCRSELYNEAVPLGNKNLRIGFAKISNVNFLCYSSPLENGLYHVCNFYRNDILQFKLGDINNPTPTSNYLILCGLDINALANVDNINYQELVKDLKKEHLTEIELHYYGKLLLQLLAVYDKTKRMDIINAVIELYEHLIKFQNLQKSELLFLNLMQSYKRIRILTEGEIQQLIDLRDKCASDDLKCGCCILLDAVQEFQYYFKKLDKEQQQNFIRYPIANLLPSGIITK